MRAPVVLLQTDVVDSTRLTERLGDAAMCDVWTAHDQLIRERLRAWNGLEVDRSDGFLLRFESVAQASAFALDCHHRLALLDPPLTMRAGIHLGPVTARENTSDAMARGARQVEIGGLSIPITARVMGLASGGQTLLTSAARDALGPTAHRIVSHGHWRLKGIEAPLELFEVGDGHAPFASPVDAEKAYRVVRHNDLWLPRRQVAHSLPAERNAFVGRSDPLARLAAKLDGGARLVSIVGPGGTGKTRLAQRFGWKWLGDFAGGVWFCDLSQATTLDGVFNAVAQGLDVPLGSLPPVEQLGAAITGRGSCLIVLDNLEQVATLIGDAVGLWMDRAPQARFVTTTRTVLNVNGEEVVSLEPMPRHDGAALFVARARAAKQDFALSTDDSQLLDRLIALLDGLPLAIELAAARVRIMDIATLVDRMKERFRLLASKSGHVSRHATLRATFDWSWDLLDPIERAALAQSSVFEGGFDLAGFEEVFDRSGIDATIDAFDVLQSLVEKSWVRQSSSSRFDMLQSVQAYAGERLCEPGSFPGAGDDGRLAARRRHWELHARPLAAGNASASVADLDNFVQACRRATAAGDARCAAGALDNAWQLLKMTGPFRAILPLASRVSELPGLATADRALVEYVTGSALLIVGSRADAQRCFDAGLAAARDAGEAAREVMLLCQLSELHTAAGRTTTAEDSLAEAMRLCTGLGDAALECVVLNASGNLHLNAGSLEEALRYYTRALTIARERLDLRWEGGLLGNLGNVNHGLGRHDVARDHYEQALGLVHRTGDLRWEGNTRCNLGLLYSEMNDAERARTYLELALASARQLGHRKLEFTVLCNLGIVAESKMQQEDALAFYRNAHDIAVGLDDPRSEGQCLGYLGMLLTRLARFDEAEASLTRAIEFLTTVADHWHLALVLCGMVDLWVALSRVDEAHSALRRAEALIDPLGMSGDTAPVQAVQRAKAQLAASRADGDAVRAS